MKILTVGTYNLMTIRDLIDVLSCYSFKQS